jgi:pSer/pThr/pTyr-binding forkhead associated (FHA) protein
MEVLLVMFRDGGNHRPFRIGEGTTIVGRREDCDLRIAVNDVSRKHCHILLEGDALSVADLGSSNGTFVNGQRVQKHVLTAGDTLQVGPVSFVVQIDGEPELTSARPPLKTTAPAKSSKKSQAIDDELDELQILNESGGASGIDLDLDEK